MDTGNILQILRKPKIMKMSIFDWILTLLGAWILTKILHKYFFSKYNYLNFLITVTILVIITGIIVHKILGIDTMLGYYLGLNPEPVR